MACGCRGWTLAATSEHGSWSGEEVELHRIGEGWVGHVSPVPDNGVNRFFRLRATLAPDSPTHTSSDDPAVGSSHHQVEDVP